MTQLRSVSGLMPSCAPICFNAPVLVAGSRRASTAIRVARSRSSSGYFLGAAMTLILTWIESLHQTRYGTGTDFFISHAGRDTGWAEWLGWQLQDAGYRVELDAGDWAPGEDFVARMQQAL